MDRTRRPGPAARVVSIAAISLLAIAPVPAHAQSAEAEKRFIEAEALLSAGKVAEACAAFEESNRIEPGAGVLIQIGLCKEKLGKLASALAAFRGALARAKDPRKKKIATDGVTALVPRVSQLTISVAPEARALGLAVTRDGEPVDAADHGRPIPVDGGSYEVAASAAGYRRWSTTVRVPPERARASVTVPALVAEGAPAGEEAGEPVNGNVDRGDGPSKEGREKRVEPAPLPAEKRSSRTVLKATGWGLAGVGVSSAAYVLYLAVAGPEADYAARSQGQPKRADGTEVAAGSNECNTALGQELRNVAHPNNYAFDEACKANKRRSVASWISLLGGVAGFTTLYFAYRSTGEPAAKPSAAGGRKRRELMVTPEIGPDGAGATLRFAW